MNPPSQSRELAAAALPSVAQLMEEISQLQSVIVQKDRQIRRIEMDNGELKLDLQRREMDHEDQVTELQTKIDALTATVNKLQSGESTVPVQRESVGTAKALPKNLSFTPKADAVDTSASRYQSSRYQSTTSGPSEPRSRNQAVSDTEKASTPSTYGTKVQPQPQNTSVPKAATAPPRSTFGIQMDSQPQQSPTTSGKAPTASTSATRLEPQPRQSPASTSGKAPKPSTSVTRLEPQSQEKPVSEPGKVQLSFDFSSFTAPETPFADFFGIGEKLRKHDELKAHSEERTVSQALSGTEDLSREVRDNIAFLNQDPNGLVLSREEWNTWGELPVREVPGSEYVAAKSYQEALTTAVAPSGVPMVVHHSNNGPTRTTDVQQQGRGGGGNGNSGHHRGFGGSGGAPHHGRGGAPHQGRGGAQDRGKGKGREGNPPRGTQAPPPGPGKPTSHTNAQQGQNQGSTPAAQGANNSDRGQGNVQVGTAGPSSGPVHNDQVRAGTTQGSQASQVPSTVQPPSAPKPPSEKPRVCLPPSAAAKSVGDKTPAQDTKPPAAPAAPAGAGPLPSKTSTPAPVQETKSSATKVADPLPSKAPTSVPVQKTDVVGSKTDKTDKHLGDKTAGEPSVKSAKDDAPALDKGKGKEVATASIDPGSVKSASTDVKPTSFTFVPKSNRVPTAAHEGNKYAGPVATKPLAPRSPELPVGRQGKQGRQTNDNYRKTPGVDLSALEPTGGPRSESSPYIPPGRRLDRAPQSGRAMVLDTSEIIFDDDQSGTAGMPPLAAMIPRANPGGNADVLPLRMRKP